MFIVPFLLLLKETINLNYTNVKEKKGISLDVRYSLNKLKTDDEYLDPQDPKGEKLGTVADDNTQKLGFFCHERDEKN